MLKPNNLSNISFKELYIKQKQSSYFKKQKDSSHWDEKAKSFNDISRHELYIDNFLQYVDFSGCKSLLDFACGSALLSKKASLFVDDVVLADFSPKMLEFAKLNCPKAQIYQIDFSKIDILPKCDLVFASRCLMIDDFYTSLIKLLDKTNKRFYFTIKKDGIFLSKQIIDILDEDISPSPDYMYVANILYELGYDFSLNHVLAQNPTYDTFDEFKNSVELSYKALNEAEIIRLKELYLKKGVKNTTDYSWVLFCVDKTN